jgi:hypothetical protein
MIKERSGKKAKKAKKSGKKALIKAKTQSRRYINDRVIES